MASEYLGHHFRVNDRVYVVENLVAEGGFALVFRARDSGSGQVAALKRMMVNNSKDLKLAKQEVAIMRALSDHRNSVTVYDWSITAVDSDIHEIIIAMELYEGGTVLELMNKRLDGGFTEAEILAIFTDILLAVTRLHHRTKQIIHRDLKVENILRSDSGHFVLCDYGSCYLQEIDPQQVGVSECEDQIKRFTTLAYRSPEMVDLYSGHKITTKADVWALGCLLYKLCFFTTPFGEQALAIMNGHFTIPDDSKYSPQIHKLIQYMLEPNPNTRPDIYQVSHLLYQINGGKNPVVNIFKSALPKFQSIPLPPTETEAKQVTAPNKKKQLAPAVVQTSVLARQRPRFGHSPNPPRREAPPPQQLPQQPKPSQIATHQRVPPQTQVKSHSQPTAVPTSQVKVSNNVPEHDFDPRGNLSPLPQTKPAAGSHGFSDSFYPNRVSESGPKNMTVPTSYDAFGSPIFSTTVGSSPSVPRPPSADNFEEASGRLSPSMTVNMGFREDSMEFDKHITMATREPQTRSPEADVFGTVPFSQAAKSGPVSTGSSKSKLKSENLFGSPPFAGPGGDTLQSNTRHNRSVSTGGSTDTTKARTRPSKPVVSRSVSSQGSEAEQRTAQSQAHAGGDSTQMHRLLPSATNNNRGKEDLFGSSPFTADQQTQSQWQQGSQSSAWQQGTDHFGSAPFNQARQISS